MSIYQELCNVISTFDSKGNRLYGHRRSDLHDCSSKYVTIEIGTEGWEREFEKLPIIESEYFAVMSHHDAFGMSILLMTIFIRILI